MKKCNLNCDFQREGFCQAGQDTQGEFMPDECSAETDDDLICSECEENPCMCNEWFYDLKKEKIEKLSKKLHKWYLEATKKLNKNSYNQTAQKKYKNLTEEQKSIDRYIAEKIIEEREKTKR